jgi:hypothetical protein
MMNDPEQILRTIRLAAPSAALEQRIQSTFAEAAQSRRKRRPIPVWRWVGWIGATGIAATVIFHATRTITPNPPAAAAPAAIQCEIESRGPLRLLLLEPPARERMPPRFSVSVSTP